MATAFVALAAGPAAAQVPSVPGVPSLPRPPGDQPPPPSGNQPAPTPAPPPSQPASGPSEGAATWQFDAAHSGYLPDPYLVPPLEVRWSRRLPSAIRTPVAGRGLVFVSTGNAVTALDASTGATRWSRGVEPLVGEIGYDTGRVYAMGSSGVLHAFDAGDGRLLWTARVPDADGSEAPVGVDGAVYVGGGSLTKLDGRSGAVGWHREEAYGRIPALDAERAFLGCSELYAFSRGGGTPAWSWRGPCDVNDRSRPITVHEGRVYVPQSATVYDAASGRVVGRYPASVTIFAGGLGVGLDDRGLTAYDLATGAPRWRAADRDRRPEGSRRFMIRAAGVNRVVYWVTRGNRLVASSLDNGARRWLTRLRSDRDFDAAELRHLGAAPGLLLVPVGRRLDAYHSRYRPAPGGIAWAPTEQHVEYRRPVRLEGVLGPELRTRAARVSVDFDEHPYGRWRRLTSFRVAPDGGFSGTIRTQRNTRLRVRAGGVVTPRTVVYTYPLATFRARRGRGRAVNRITMTVGLRFDPALRLAGRRLYLYLGRVALNRFDRLGSAILRPRGRGRAVAVVRFRAPRRVGRRDIVDTCIPRMWRLGLGPASRPARRCGAARLRAQG